MWYAYTKSLWRNIEMWYAYTPLLWYFHTHLWSNKGPLRCMSLFIHYLDERYYEATIGCGLCYYGAPSLRK